MKYALSFTFALGLLSSSTFALDSNSITLDAGGDEISCDKNVKMDYTFNGYVKEESFTYGLSLKVGSSEDATLIYKTMMNGNENAISHDDGYETIGTFDDKITSLMSTLYTNGTLQLDTSKTYDVSAFVGPGPISNYKDGKFMNSYNSEVESSRMATSTNTVTFKPSDCSNSELPTSTSST